MLQIFPLQEPAFKWADANGAKDLRWALQMPHDEILQVAGSRSQVCVAPNETLRVAYSVFKAVKAHAGSSQWSAAQMASARSSCPHTGLSGRATRACCRTTGIITRSFARDGRATYTLVKLLPLESPTSAIPCSPIYPPRIATSSAHCCSAFSCGRLYLSCLSAQLHAAMSSCVSPCKQG